MFSEYVNIISISLNSFNTSKCTQMIARFKDCISLISLDLNNFLMSTVTDIGQMFYGCKSLTSLDLSSFSGFVKHLDSMFRDC